jgi:hypothetical protein
MPTFAGFVFGMKQPKHSDGLAVSAWIAARWASSSRQSWHISQRPAPGCFPHEMHVESVEYGSFSLISSYLS